MQVKEWRDHVYILWISGWPDCMVVHGVTDFIVINPGVHGVQRGQDHHGDTEHHTERYGVKPGLLENAHPRWKQSDLATVKVWSPKFKFIICYFVLE